MGYQLNLREMDEIMFRLKGRMAAFHKNENIPLKNWGENIIGCVQEGLVYLCVEDETYERKILRFFRPGECFAAAMALPVSRGISYMTAKYPSKIVLFGRDEFLQMCLTRVEWMQRLKNIVRGQLEENLLEHNYILHHKSLRMKLLCYLKMECVIQGANTLVLPMPFCDLADYLAVDRSAMMKEIAKLKEEGILTGTRRSVTFCDKGE